MEKEYINLGELKDFVGKHKLRDMYSNIHFKALVSIKTALNEILNEEMEVRITFDGYDNYGKVTLLADYLDPNLFPTEFDAKWQKMEYKGNIFLNISDIHKRNPSIGKYNVKIVPLSKRRTV